MIYRPMAAGWTVVAAAINKYQSILNFKQRVDDFKMLTHYLDKKTRLYKMV